MNELINLLKEADKYLHSPFVHTFIYEEKACEQCKLKKKIAEKLAEKQICGFDRSDLADVADALETGYEDKINVGDAIEPGHDVFVETTTKYASRFIRAVLK